MPSALYCGRCLSTFQGNGETCPNLACGAHRPNEGWGVVLAAGDVLDRHYRIEKCLAVGGAGLTYLARELGADGEPIPPRLAIKVLYSARATGPFLRRLSTEAQILQELAHPNIVQLRGFVHRAGMEPYLVTRFEEGGSLATHVDTVGPLAVGVVVGVMSQILRALHVAHQRGVIHRDLKPDNVLLAEPVSADAVPSVRIADFGIAKIEGGVGDRLTRSGAFVGTPEFAAPEQFDGKTPTPATDVFASGMLLVFLVTGKPAIELDQRGDIEASREKLLANLPFRLPAIRGADEAGQAAMQRILDGMTALDPDARWSIDQVLEALAPLASGGTTFTFENPANPPDRAPERLAPPKSADAPPPASIVVPGSPLVVPPPEVAKLPEDLPTADAPLLPRAPDAPAQDWTLAFARPDRGPDRMPTLDDTDAPPPPPRETAEAPATVLVVLPPPPPLEAPSVSDAPPPPSLPPLPSAPPEPVLAEAPPVPAAADAPPPLPEEPSPVVLDDVAPPPPVVQAAANATTPPSLPPAPTPGAPPMRTATPRPALPRAAPAPVSDRAPTTGGSLSASGAARPLATPVVDAPEAPRFPAPSPPVVEVPTPSPPPPARSGAAGLAGCFGLSLFGMGAVGALGFIGVGLVLVVVAALAGWFRDVEGVAPRPTPVVVVPGQDPFTAPELPRGAQERIARLLDDQAHDIGQACGHGGDTEADLALDVTGAVVDAHVQFEKPQQVDERCVVRRLQRIRIRLANPNAGVAHASFRL